jgi:hypothetical protein
MLDYQHMGQGFMEAKSLLSALKSTVSGDADFRAVQPAKIVVVTSLIDLVDEIVRNLEEVARKHDLDLLRLGE